MCFNSFVVKNTFISFLVEDEHDEPESQEVHMRRKRSCTTGDAGRLAKLSEETLSDFEENSSDSDNASDSDSEDGESSVEMTMEELTLTVSGALAVGQYVSPEILVQVCASASDLVFEEIGSELLMQILDQASPTLARQLAQGLQGHVCAAARSPYGHVVLEKLLHCLVSADTVFIAEELQGHGLRAAANMHGHSVLCRLLEYTHVEEATLALADEVIGGDAGSLCCHKFGHIVAMSILSNGTDAQRSLIANAWRANLQRFTRHRFASTVLEHVLTHGSARDRDELAAELIRQPNGVANLACHCFGIQVVRALASTPYFGQIARHNLQHNAKKIAKDKYGLKLLTELDLLVSEPSVISIASMIAAGA